MTSPSVYYRLKQQLQPTPEQSNDKVRKFELGDKVLVRDFAPLEHLNGSEGLLQPYVVN